MMTDFHMNEFRSADITSLQLSATLNVRNEILQL